MPVVVAGTRRGGQLWAEGCHLLAGAGGGADTWVGLRRAVACAEPIWSWGLVSAPSAAMQCH